MEENKIHNVRISWKSNYFCLLGVQTKNRLLSIILTLLLLCVCRRLETLEVDIRKCLHEAQTMATTAFNDGFEPLWLCFCFYWSNDCSVFNVLFCFQSTFSIVTISSSRKQMCFDKTLRWRWLFLRVCFHHGGARSLLTSGRQEVTSVADFKTRLFRHQNWHWDPFGILSSSSERNVNPRWKNQGWMNSWCI